MLINECCLLCIDVISTRTWTGEAVDVGTTYLSVLGTFGQPHHWNINNSSTFEHPMVPYDVLTDPLDIPGYQTDSSAPPDVVTTDVEENGDNQEEEEDLAVEEVRCQLSKY